LPVVAVDEGGPRDLIEDGVTGLLRPARTDALADAMLELAASPNMRARLAGAGERAARTRTWERALGQLAAGYARALEPAEAARRAA